MRADTLTLRVGTSRDTLVVLGGATDADLGALRNRFSAWLDPAMHEELATTAPAFVVQLDPAPGERRGVRTLPHLRHGNEVLARGTGAEVLDALDHVLGGINDRAVDDPRPWVNLRLFTDGTRAVLTDTPRPHLVDDRDLRPAGIVEIVGWGVLVDADSVQVPAPLTGGSARRLELTGIVAYRTASTTAAELLASLAAHSVHPSWFQTVSASIESGSVHTARDRNSARRALAHFLTKS